MLVKGPFNLTWGNNTIEDIEEIEFEHTIATEDLETIQGRTIELDGAYKVTVIVTLLATDVPALAAILPQHFKAQGETMSTGEEVTDENGAIDVVPSDCDDELLFNDLEIVACGNPANVLRVVNTRTKIESIEMDSMIRKVAVKFVGEASSSQATVQFFTSGGLTPVS
jgi:hypothetical protein